MNEALAGDCEAMTWPWSGHEHCESVHLARIRGELCGRVCKTCSVAEVHLLGPPGGGPFSGHFDLDPIPVGPDGEPQQGGTA